MKGAVQRLALLALVLPVAACMAPPDSTDPPNTTPLPADSCSNFSRPVLVEEGPFQGENAFAHVLHIVCDFDQTPAREQPRVPGTPGRLAAAQYLHGALASIGLQVSFENFTGRDYDALPKGSVEDYADGRQCTSEDRTRMLDLDFSNIIAEIGSGDPLTILVAHYDSQRFASRERDPANQTKPVVGANDASGVGVLVEAARVLSASPPDRTVRILLVDGEDGFEECHPLAGSIYHAQGVTPEEKARLDGVFLLDMVGDPEPHFCLTGDAGLAERVRAAARNESVAIVADASSCGEIYDDHTAFLDAGMRAVDLIDYDLTRPGGFTFTWNTTRDTPEKLSAARMGEVGRAVVELVS